MPKEEIDEINDKLDKIISLMYNDVETNRKGLVQKLDDLEKVVDKIILNAKVINAKRSVWMLVIGAIGAGVVFIAKAVIAKIFGV